MVVEKRVDAGWAPLLSCGCDLGQGGVRSGLGVV